MNPRKRETRLYARNGRWWADFRDVGGRQEPMVPTGERMATTDRDLAERLAAARLEELERLREVVQKRGVREVLTVEEAAARYLHEKAEAGNTRASTLENIEYRLRIFCEAMPADPRFEKGDPRRRAGGDRYLHEIDAGDVKALMSALRKRKSRKGGTLSRAIQRHVLDSGAALFRWAQEEALYHEGLNPCKLRDRPKIVAVEAPWLEPTEVAALLDAAANRYGVTSVEFAALSTFAYTGGRRMEVLGLEPGDIAFERRRVFFRPNGTRLLKTPTSKRAVPLWPRLEAILRAYLRANPRIGEVLLFDSLRSKRGGLTSGWDYRLRKLKKDAQLRQRVTIKSFRHAYASARLQTLDRGEPVSPFTVTRELGHKSTAMLDSVYAHLGEFRHRAEIVDFPFAEGSLVARTFPLGESTLSYKVGDI